MQQDRDIHALYNQLSDAERALFDSYFARELRTALEIANEQAQESGLGAADPGVVEADLIDELILRTDGRGADDNGVGFVPMPDGEYRIIPPTRNPFEAADATAADTGMPSAHRAQRQRWLLAGAVLVVGLLTTWWSIGGRDEPPPSAPEAQASSPAAPSRAPGSVGQGDTTDPTDPYAPAPERIGQRAGTTPITDAEVRRAGASYPSSLEIVMAAGEDSPPSHVPCIRCWCTPWCPVRDGWAGVGNLRSRRALPRG